MNIKNFTNLGGEASGQAWIGWNLFFKMKAAHFKG